MSNLFRRIACAALSATLVLGSVPTPALAEMAPMGESEMGVDEQPTAESTKQSEGGGAGEGELGTAPLAQPDAKKDESSPELVTESDEMPLETGARTRRRPHARRCRDETRGHRDAARGNRARDAGERRI